jgi:D-ribose pyranase
MLKTGILNPHVLELLARIRHTNTLVIADWAFPYWPEIETVDLSLTHGIPTVLDVLDLITPVFKIGRIWQAEEFLANNAAATVERFRKSFGDIPLTREAHGAFKTRVPMAIGLIRTGDPTPYANVIIESA